jgi:hypothetical protein
VAERLEEAVIRDLHAASAAILERSGVRQTLCYLPGVRSAHLLAEMLCAARPGSAMALDGTTPTDERRALLAGHSSGEYQYLANCMVLTEGYDSPAVSCLAMLRPTVSRSLYAQMLGRGLRPSVGKADCLVLDFNGCTGRHSLAGPEDILGGSYTAEEVERAKKEPDADGDVKAALRKSRERIRYEAAEEEQRKARKKAKKLIPRMEAARLLGLQLGGGGGEPSPKQRDVIRRFGVDPDGLSRADARVLLDVLIGRAKRGQATIPQMRLLASRGIDVDGATRESASRVIGMLAAKGWK